MCYWIALTLLLSFLGGGDSPKLSVRHGNTATKSNGVTYQVDFSAVVTPPYGTRVLKIWMPIPPSDDVQTVANSRLSSFPMVVEPRIGVEATHGNKFAYFEFREPKGAQIVRHQFSITTHELNWNVDPKKVVKVDQWPRELQLYLRDEPLIPTVGRFREIAQGIAREPTNASQDLAAVMDWVNRTMKYSHEDCSLQGSAVHALDKKVGHCSDYHGICSALSRSLGYPTRIAYGINPFPKNSPSHCKLEAYLPPYGWVMFDVSETQQMIARIQKDTRLDDAMKRSLTERANARLRSGFRDNTWFLQTRGSDYEVVPPAAKKVPLVRTVYVEADGVALPEPDPANPNQRAFSWMTVHHYQADRAVTNPFQDWNSLVK